MHDVEDAQLPYCLTSWPELDGRQVLFNRNYEPIWQRLPGRPAVPANPEERIARWSNEFFYDEVANPKRLDPWRSRETRKILETVLAEFIAGREVRQWVVQIERGAVLRGRSSRPASGYEHYPHSGTIRTAADLKHPHCAFTMLAIRREAVHKRLRIDPCAAPRRRVQQLFRN
jgi:hypothetical protein